VENSVGKLAANLAPNATQARNESEKGEILTFSEGGASSTDLDKFLEGFE